MAAAAQPTAGVCLQRRSKRRRHAHNAEKYDTDQLRYRGYYYDTETGFYYLQSRYYDPAIGRFISADTFARTGHGFIGCNMFAYCGNNPVNYADPSGHFLREMGAAFVHALQQASAIFAFAGAVSQIDSPLPGPADIVAGCIVVGTTLFCVSVALYTTTTAPPTNAGSIRGSTLPDIAEKYGQFKCKEAAEAMQSELTKNNRHGNLVTIQYFGFGHFNNIWSNSRDMVVSENGFHCGIEYNGIVYGNIHPQGLPVAQWINNFEGFGFRQISYIPF